MYTEARGVWENAPPGKFDALRWLLRLLWGPKHKQRQPRMCGHRTLNLLILGSQQLSLLCPDCDVRVDMDLYGLLTCKPRVSDAISVKTLVWRSPRLPDLLHRTCTCARYRLYSQIEIPSTSANNSPPPSPKNKKVIYSLVLTALPPPSHNTTCMWGNHSAHVHF